MRVVACCMLAVLMTRMAEVFWSCFWPEYPQRFVEVTHASVSELSNWWLRCRLALAQCVASYVLMSHCGPQGSSATLCFVKHSHVLRSK